MTEEKRDTHRDHVGIGITRRSYNKFKKLAKAQDVSMRKYLDQLARTL